MQDRAVYVAIGVNLQGSKEVLGFWSAANEGARFWLQVLTEIRNRGAKDSSPGLTGSKGFPEAIEPLFPRTQAQLCSVHMVSTRCTMCRKQRREVATDLRTIDSAATTAAAALALTQFSAKWDKTDATLLGTGQEHAMGSWRAAGTFPYGVCFCRTSICG